MNYLDKLPFKARNLVDGEIIKHGDYFYDSSKGTWVETQRAGETSSTGYLYARQLTKPAQKELFTPLSA